MGRWQNQTSNIVLFSEEPIMSASANPPQYHLRAFLQRAAALLLAVPLAGFFGFVGFMKATAPVSELARHGAWTVHIPEIAGRLAGASEMLCATALVAGAIVLRTGKAAIAAAIVLIVNQGVAALIHHRASEFDHLPQNAALAAALAIMALLVRQRMRT